MCSDPFLLDINTELLSLLCHFIMAMLPTPKVAVVHNVFFQRKGETRCQQGTLRLTSHHLIFEPQSASRPRQMAYSLLLNVTRMPSLRIAAQAGSSSRIFPVTLFQKDFDSCAIAFRSEDDQTAVFDSLKDCAVLSDVSQLYAFHYQPESLPSTAKIYDFRKEFARQGIGSRSKAWRFTDVNAQYAFCPSYPSHMVVPSRISDTTLNYAAKYRSKERIPALTYLHWANHASITRSSQPMVGLKNARSIQDEKLIEAIFTSHHYADPESSTAKAAVDAANTAPGTVYGATSTNLIIDARPTTNAMANVAKGAGTENMEYYKGCKKSYLGIDNIHVMRDSLNKLTDALRESEPTATFGMRVESLEDAPLKLSPTPVDVTALRRSSWLKHIQSLLEGSMSIVRNVHINSSHVLIHCSDGWDRTSQLAAIAQVCLDPYFRTFEGLAVLIEKDWLSFGHKFTDRGGQKGCEKYFSSKYSYSEEEDGDGTDGELEKAAASGGFDSQAAANAFWGFTKQLTANFSAATSSSSASHKGSHIKETSPVFQQFLDCLWQIMRQYPTRFEYNADYLTELLRTIHECKYGTFLLNCDRQRLRPEDIDGKILPPLSSKTVSAWGHLLAGETKKRFANPSYQPELDDRDPKRVGTDMGVLIADARDVRYFERLFQKAEGDMNAYLDKEADERRRAKDRLERAVRGGEGSANASSTNLATDPVTVGPGDVDPVLNPLGVALPTPGAVELTRNVDQTKLAYQARQPRSHQPATSPAPDGSADAAPNMQTAADAANRMKNLFIGGWGRLQEAMASPTSAENGFDVPPRKSSVSDLQHDTRPRSESEMPLFAKQGNPWTASNGIRDEMHREHVSMRSRIHDSQSPAGAPREPWATPSAPQQHEPDTDEAKKTASDPLGVL